jgi:hypothetical protein
MKILILIILIAIPHSALKAEGQSPGVSMNQLAKIKKVFNELREDNGHILNDFYAKDSNFIDPIVNLNGLGPIKKYYKNIYQGVKEIEFVFTDSVSSGNKHVVVWTMKLRAEKLKNGELMELHGNSVIVFNEDDLVSYHRDYYDMGEFIYENVPVLGWIVKSVKNRLKKH